MLSRDVIHLEIPRGRGEHRLSMEMMRADSKHLKRKDFEGALPFRHSGILRKTTIR
jgi:hypothetical protein